MNELLLGGKPLGKVDSFKFESGYSYKSNLMLELSFKNENDKTIMMDAIREYCNVTIRINKEELSIEVDDGT